MIAGWRRIDMPANGAAKRPSAPPLVQGAGTPPSGDEWEKLFSAVAPRYRYEDLVVPAAVQAQLDNALARVRCHPIVYEAWGMKAKNPYGGGLVLNLYGPPGTGKTHAAEAIAHRLGRLLIDIDYAALISKYVGDTGKAIAGAFRAAERTGAVLVFNEGDTVLTSRLQRPANSADKGGNDAVVQMLRTLERFQGVVIFTSNLFASYDSASLRRIKAHVRFELPDRDCRRRLWQHLLPEAVPLAPDVTPDRLAEASDSLAGGDMLNAAETALVSAADRSGPAGPVTWEDFALALAQERDARESHRGQARVVSEAVIDPADLPAEAKAKFKAAGTEPTP